jgi:hypothetical protein
MCPSRPAWRRGARGREANRCKSRHRARRGTGTACDPGCEQPTVECFDQVLAPACATTPRLGRAGDQCGRAVGDDCRPGRYSGRGVVGVHHWGHGDADRGNGPRARWSQRSTDRSSRDLREEPAMSTRSHRRPALTVQATLVVRPPGTSRYALPRPPSPAQMRRSGACFAGERVDVMKKRCAASA